MDQAARVYETVAETVVEQSGFQSDGEETALVESAHPYAQGTVTRTLVQCGTGVAFLQLEFDAPCATARAEDSLTVYVPHCGRELLAGRFSLTAWPTQAWLVPGNAAIFEFSSCSPAEQKIDAAALFGFRVSVTGFRTVSNASAVCDPLLSILFVTRWQASDATILHRLQAELRLLRHACIVQLMAGNDAAAFLPEPAAGQPRLTSTC